MVDDKKNSLIEDGLQMNYGLGILYGTGIELDINKRIMLKSEFRYQLFNHLILFGIGYKFSK